MVHSNPYTRYAQESADVVGELLSTPDLPVAQGATRQSFIDAADHAHSLILGRLGTSLPEKLRTDQVRHGMRVMARFAYYSTLRANQLGLASSTLLSALQHPATFEQTLEPLATEDNEVTKRVERIYGLWAESDNPTPENRFDFLNNGSLRLNAVTPTLKLAAYTLLDQQGVAARANAQCSAHRARALEPIYNHMMPLYAQHEQLGGAIVPVTLAELSTITS